MYRPDKDAVGGFYALKWGVNILPLGANRPLSDDKLCVNHAINAGSFLTSLGRVGEDKSSETLSFFLEF